jgi:hypothetical protein
MRPFILKSVAKSVYTPWKGYVNMNPCKGKENTGSDPTPFEIGPEPVLKRYCRMSGTADMGKGQGADQI